MKNIQLVHVGEDYITVSYTDANNNHQEIEITGDSAIQVIATLAKALHKKSFEPLWNN